MIQKMAKKMKMVEKHLEIVSQVSKRMKLYLSSLLVIKIYDINLHTLDTTECQDLASRVEENARQNLARRMDLYEKSIYDIQRYIQWPKINLEDKHPVTFSFFQKLENKYEKIKEEVHAK
jgi:hypothetical protein